MIRRLSNIINKVVNLIASSLRRTSLRLKCGWANIPESTIIQRGCKFKVTDEGKLSLKSDISFDSNVHVIVKHGELEIGSNSYVGIGAVIVARKNISIGNHALIAEYVTIRDQDHEFESSRNTNESGFRTAPITIGDNVWIGAKATITKGVTIGDNVVIGANSVVNSDIPSNCVAAGAPARVIRRTEKTPNRVENY